MALGSRSPSDLISYLWSLFLVWEVENISPGLGIILIVHLCPPNVFLLLVLLRAASGGVVL